MSTETLTEIALKTAAASSSAQQPDLKKYTYEEALKSSVDYFKGDELAAQVWLNKYALKDSFGNIYELNPDHMHRRMAREIARVEARYPKA